MRLLILTGEFPDMIGGLSEHSENLGRGLRALGHDVEVLTTADPRVRQVAGLRVTSAVSSWRDRGVVRLALERPPDAALVQYSPYLYDSLGMPGRLVRSLAALRRRVPVVLVAHELFIPWGGLRLLPLWIGQRLVSTSALRLADGIAISTERRHAQLRRAGFDERRLRLIRVGPATSPPTGALEPPPADPVFRVGVFASLDLNWRRPDLVAHAVREMGERCPQRPVSLALMGRLPENTARFLASAPLRGPGYEILATGALPASEVSRRLLGCHAAALLDTSGLGGISSRSSSAASALALARPLLANRGPETDSVFCDGENVLFTDLAVDAIRGGLERLRDDPHLRERLARGAARLHREHLAWDVISASFELLIRSALERHASRRGGVR